MKNNKINKTTNKIIVGRDAYYKKLKHYRQFKTWIKLFDVGGADIIKKQMADELAIMEQYKQTHEPTKQKYISKKQQKPKNQ